jgi:hypothetical protein
LQQGLMTAAEFDQAISPQAVTRLGSPPANRAATNSQ